MSVVSTIKKELHNICRRKELYNLSKYNQSMIYNMTYWCLVFCYEIIWSKIFMGSKFTFLEMGIRTVSDYVKFYMGLNMQDSISLSSFAYNEKLVLNNKTATGKLTKELICAKSSSFG